MSCEDTSGLFGCRPVLSVDNVARSLAYYIDVLGFRLGLAWSNDEQRFLSPGDACVPQFAIIGRGSIQLMLAEQTQGAPGMWLHFDIDTGEHLDALQREWAEKGARIIEPPSIRPWGMYEMRVEDLDGHVFRVSAPPTHP